MARSIELHSTVKRLQKLVNPESGKPDLMGAIAFVLARFDRLDLKASEQNPEYYWFDGKMTEQVTGSGVSLKFRADFILLLQHADVFRKHGGGSKVQWEVLQSKHLPRKLARKQLIQALGALSTRKANQWEELKRRKAEARTQAAEAKAQAAENGGSPTTSDSNVTPETPSFQDQALEALALLEVKNEEIEQLRARITELEAENERLREQASSSDFEAKFAEKLSALRST